MRGGSRPTSRASTLWRPLLALLAACWLASCNAAPDPIWHRIQTQGVLRVGMEANWVPFEYVDGAGRLTGYDVELAQALAERLGLEVQFFPNLSFDGLYDALEARRVDAVISAVVVDLGRSADFAFSTPYFDAGQVLVVGPHSAAVDEMRDLAGRVLAVQLGSDADAVARRWARRLSGTSLRHTDSSQAAFEAVAAGQADAALTDRATALLALRTYGEHGLHVSGAPVTDEQYAVVVLKESDALLRAVNAALAEMRRDGTLDALEKKWLGP